MNEEERYYKGVISEAMGDGFCDALFEGTTSETLVVGFKSSLATIAFYCKRDGFISLSSASFILRRDNPGKQYRVDMFASYAKRAMLVELKAQIGKLEQEMAELEEEVARISKSAND
jgi:hypothetical protein